ncbi:MAG: M43 family zinc metalloprotease [Chitinophagaceae bacterium]|nr:M43 family zinc metalloprotease [Chitinophagaceae bacterium]
MIYNSLKIFNTILIVSLLFITKGFAQTPICGFDKIYHKQLADPVMSQKIKEFNNAILAKENQIRALRSATKNAKIIGGEVYEIPVVVHVIYRPADPVGSRYNPSDAGIQAMIDHLNEVYAGGNNFNMGASLPFRFKLAQRTPQCTATTGIERIDGSSLSGFNTDGISLPGSGATGAAESDMKKLSLWPVTGYYNIWIVWKINAVGLPLNSYISGYANLPFSSGVSGTDGAVLNAQIVNGTSSTLSHEMGHAMGLLHTFEGGDADNCPPVESEETCSTMGDLVCDTDPVKNLLSAGVLADNMLNPCTEKVYNGSQRNIMGYGSGLNLFTNGQKDRAIATFQLARAGFMTSLGAETPPATLVKSVSLPLNISNPGNSFNMGPCSVSFNTLQYSSYGYDKNLSDFFVDNTCNLGTKLIPEESYTLSVTTQTNRQVCKAWIDFNNDGNFDGNEMVLNSSATTAVFTHTTSIPSSRFYASGVVYDVPLRMRIAADFINNADFLPTGQLQYGQIEDFYVQIKAPNLVTFGGINAKIVKNNLDINWTTSSEKNNDHFILEVSKDGSVFKELGTVNSTASGGNSDTSLSYSLSKTAKDVNGILGLWILPLLLAGIGSYKSRKWISVAIIVLVFGIFTNTSCRKKDVVIKSDQVFVRVKAVSKTGFVMTTNAIKAIKQ